MKRRKVIILFQFFFDENNISVLMWSGDVSTQYPSVYLEEPIGGAFAFFVLDDVWVGGNARGQVRSLRDSFNVSLLHFVCAEG